MNRHKIVWDPPYFEAEEKVMIESIDFDAISKTDEKRHEILRRELQEFARATKTEKPT